MTLHAAWPSIQDRGYARSVRNQRHTGITIIYSAVLHGQGGSPALRDKASPAIRGQSWFSNLQSLALVAMRDAVHSTSTLDRLKGIGPVGIFGAKGFIGVHVVRQLARLQVPVIAFARSFPRDYLLQVGYDVECRDIEFGDVIGTHAALQGVTSVVQLINSSAPSVGNGHVIADLKSNVLPHVGFVESCLQSDVRRFIFISSGGTVYGTPLHLPIRENHPTVPLNSYGLTKLTVERYIDLLARNSSMSCFNLRVSNPYGPGQTLKKGQGLVAAILQRSARGQALTISGDGSAIRDYLYIDDVVSAILAALVTSAEGETLNIASGVGVTVMEMVAAIERLTGRSIAVEYTPARSTDVQSVVLDNSKAADILGWRPQVSLDSGLIQTLGTPIS